MDGEESDRRIRERGDPDLSISSSFQCLVAVDLVNRNGPDAAEMAQICSRFHAVPALLVSNSFFFIERGNEIRCGR